jgi:hypothetical protein
MPLWHGQQVPTARILRPAYVPELVPRTRAMTEFKEPTSIAELHALVAASLVDVGAS